MILTYQYRMYPSAVQKEELRKWLRICQYWYNRQLGERFQWFETNRLRSCPIEAPVNQSVSGDKLVFTKRVISKKSQEDERLGNGQPIYFSCPIWESQLIGEIPPVEEIPGDYDRETRFKLADQPSQYSQSEKLTQLKQEPVFVEGTQEWLDLNRVTRSVMTDVGARVNKAFERYLKGDSSGNRSGKPRFKSQKEFTTMRWGNTGQAEVKLVRDNWLYLNLPLPITNPLVLEQKERRLGRKTKHKNTGWGYFKVRMHRPIPDGFTVENASVTLKADGWYVQLCLEDKTVPALPESVTVPTWDNTVGIDAVLHKDTYLALSDGTKLPSLKPLLQRKDKLARIATKRNVARKGSAARRKLAQKEARLHQRIARARKDFQYKTAHALIKRSPGKDTFVIEDLSLKSLIKRKEAIQDSSGKYLENGQELQQLFNLSWSDASFGQFFSILELVAAKYGANVQKQPCEYTTQVLCYRNEFVFTDLSKRTYKDETEGLTVDMDVNAAINLVRLQMGTFPAVKKDKHGNLTIVGDVIDADIIKGILRNIQDNIDNLVINR